MTLAKQANASKIRPAISIPEKLIMAGVVGTE